MEWPTVNLGSISEVITKGTTPTSVGFKFTDSGVNFVKVESISANGQFLPQKFAAITEECNEALKRSQLREGDILFSIAGALGRTALVTADILPANTNQALALIRLKGEVEIDKSYLLLALKTAITMDQIEKHRGGVAQQNLSLSQLNGFEVPLPPIREQKHIVTILDQAFADIDRARALTEQNLKNARELFESKLQQVFSQGGEGWEAKPLESFSNIVNGYAFKSGDFSSDNKVKSIKITNVGVYEFVEESENYLPSSFLDEYRQYRAFSGDVVVALTRTIISSGLKVAVVPDSYDEALINQRVAAVQVDEKVMTKETLQAFLSTKMAIDYVRSNVNELMQPNLSIKDLKAFPIPVPPANKRSEVNKQIADLRKQTDELVKIYKSKVESLDELKKSILQKAFAGELSKDEEGVAA